MLNLHQTFRSLLARARSTGLPGRRDAADCPAPGLAAQLYWARRRRSERFGGDLFFEPTWDLLLYLYDAWEAGKAGIRLERAAEASRSVSPASARRWIDFLEGKGLIEAFEDEAGTERVALTDRGRDSMSAYLAEMKAAAPL